MIIHSRLIWTLGGALLVCLAAPVTAVPLHLTTPDPFALLAEEPEVVAYRVEGEWTAWCDSLAGGAGGSSLDCFTRTGEVRVDPAGEGLQALLDVLRTCVWTRSRGWNSPAAPTLGFRFGPDSASADLLVSLRAMKATLTIPLEGSAGAFVPESLYVPLCVALWMIDPENPDVVEPIRKLRVRRAVETGTWSADAPDPGTDPDALPQYDEPPTPVSLVQPAYPEMAREAKIQGRVVLQVLVGADGRVKKVKVIRSIPYLEDASKNAVLRWVFKPALLKGHPVPAWVEVPVDFHF